jgi:hypothetical protein
MSRFGAQLIVLAAFGVAFCQGITESVPIEKDSSIVNIAPPGADPVTSDTTSPADTMAIVDVQSESQAVIPNNDSTAMAIDSIIAEKPSDMTVPSGELKRSEDTAKTGTALSQPVITEKKVAGRRNGIGINLTVKLIVSKALNNYLEDLYEKMKDDANGIITDEVGFSAMPIMLGFKIKGIVYVGPVLGLEPFGTVNYGLKIMRIRNLETDVTTNLMEYGGGLNMWARVSSAKVVSFKAGLGGYVTYTYLNVESYDGTVNHSGIGGGINLLVGVDIMLKNVTLNVDVSVPIGSSELSQDGSFTNSGNNQIRYPDGYRHTGVEIRPGITFLF